MARELDFVDECYKDKDLSLLKKLTLVIPTYNRNYYLSRCLWYHAHFPFGQIIVADSSPEEKKVVNRETVAKIREMFGANVLYLEYQPETEKYGGDIYRKWGDAVQHVETEYSEICTDKEFVIPTVCCESIAFLAENPDYVNAFGMRGDCNYKLSTIKITPFPDMKSCNQPSAIERLYYCNLIKNYPENLFHIYHSKTHKEIYSNLEKSTINDIRYGELFLDLSPYMLGKCEKINTIGRARDNTQYNRRGIYKTVNKSESSSLRYAFLDTYPKERRDEIQRCFVQWLFDLIPDEEKSDGLKKRLDSELNQIVHWWMWRNPDSKTDRHSFLWGIVWETIPEKVKVWLSSHIGSGKYVYITHITQNDKNIETIILNIAMFRKNNLNDLVIDCLT